MADLDFAGRRVLVLGDIMLDEFVYGDASRLSPEAVVPVLRRAESTRTVGGAGNVARIVAGLGGTCRLVGVVGQDEPAVTINASLIAAKVDADLVVDKERLTTVKTRYVDAGAHQHLLRVDTESAGRIRQDRLWAVLQAVLEHLEWCEVLVISDYGKGVIDDAILFQVIETALAKGRYIVVDPKGKDLNRYYGAHVLTPNAQEWEHSRIDRLPPAVVVTQGPRGMLLKRRGAPDLDSPAFPVPVRDVSGAGDAVVAILALTAPQGSLGNCIWWSWSHRLQVANAAAAVVVSKPGVATVSVSEIEAMLAHGHNDKTQDWTALEALVNGWKTAGLKVVFTNGCFDLMHPGHIKLLKAAKALGDRLVVAINSDESVRALKGPNRPVQTAAARAQVLAALSCVDCVTIFSDGNPRALLERLRPDVLVKGADYTADQVIGREYAGEVKLIELAPGFSTSNIVKKLNGGDNGITGITTETPEAAV